MKGLRLIELIIVGFFTGVVVSIYILFMDSLGRDIGIVLKTLSLSNFINHFPYEYNSSILFVFLYYILVCIVYFIICNLLFGINRKIKFILIFILVAILLFCIYQQVSAFKTPLIYLEYVAPYPQIVTQKEIGKYFGEEVRGDLNGDNVEDVAFLIKRNENDDRGDMYYLASSLKNKDGYKGLNLLFVGQKISIEDFNIDNGTIIINYNEIDFDKNSFFRARVIDDKLIEETEEENFGEPIDQPV